MNKDFEDYNVQCPYYLEEGLRTVKCEGVVKKSSMQHQFSAKAQKADFKNSYCCGAWKTCPVAVMLCKKYDYLP